MNPTGPTPPPPPRKRPTRRLRSAENVRAFVADTIRRVESEGEDLPLDPRRARVLLYGASILAQLVQAADFEERLRALERQVAEQQGKRLSRPGEGRLAS